MPTAVHGKDYYVSIATKDLSTYIKTSNWETTPEIHDITGSGTDDKSYRGGQIGHTFTIGGWYDTSETTGPAFLETMFGQTVAFVRRVAGTGTGRPAQAGNLVVGKYSQSQKNDDITTWTVDLTITGAITRTTQ